MEADFPSVLRKRVEPLTRGDISTHDYTGEQIAPPKGGAKISRGLRNLTTPTKFGSPQSETSIRITWENTQTMTKD